MNSNLNSNASTLPVKKKNSEFALLWKERYLLLFLLPMIIFLFIFNYIPMYGIVIAFQKYRMGKPFLAFDGSIEWVGLQNFIKLFTSYFFPRALKNTLILSSYLLVFGFWVPIIFSLILNEVRHKVFKKVTQTFSYLPYFISTVIIAGIVMGMLSTDGGVVNTIIVLFKGKPIQFLNEPKYFRAIFVIVSIWQTFGWSSVIYLASISSINPEYYEASIIDGANRFKQALYITLPCLLPTICILLILNLGQIMLDGSAVEKILLLYNPGIYDTSDVLGTYTIRSGIFENSYSYAAAIGLFTSLINFITLVISNKIVNKTTGNGLF